MMQSGFDDGVTVMGDPPRITNSARLLRGGGGMAGGDDESLGQDEMAKTSVARTPDSFMTPLWVSVMLDDGNDDFRCIPDM